jgi:hypothetical protein
MNAGPKKDFPAASIAFIDRATEPDDDLQGSLRSQDRADIDARSGMIRQILKIAGFKFIEGTYEFQTLPHHPDYYSTIFTRAPDLHDPEARIFKHIFISSELQKNLPEISALHIHAGIDGFTLETLFFDGDQHSLEKNFTATGENLPLILSDFIRPFMPTGADRIMDLRIKYGQPGPSALSAPPQVITLP